MGATLIHVPMETLSVEEDGDAQAGMIEDPALNRIGRRRRRPGVQALAQSREDAQSLAKQALGAFIHHGAPGADQGWYPPPVARKLGQFFHKGQLGQQVGEAAWLR